jgi:hypothetical protein
VLACGSLAYMKIQAVDHYETTCIENYEKAREGELIKFNKELTLKTTSHSGFNPKAFRFHEGRIDHITQEINDRSKKKPIIILVELIKEHKP